MKIAVLDADTLGKDLDLSPLFELGEVSVYAKSSPDEIPGRIAEAEVAIVNKVAMNEKSLGGNTSLRLICIAATGYDNIDVSYCRNHGIAVCNVVGYSTNSVSQLTVAMALSLVNHLPEYTESVRNGSYTEGGVANRLVPVYHELCGKTWGIVGYGNIGSQVGKVASALGCRVLAFKRTPSDSVECTDLDTLCRESDIISIHLPLSESTRGIIGQNEIAAMKKSAIVINVARGAVTDERALANAILNGELGGIGVDVYSSEPMSNDHPFYGIRDRANVCLTPHMAWGSYEARVRCLGEIIENIRAFRRSERRSRVD